MALNPGNGNGKGAGIIGRAKAAISSLLQNRDITYGYSCTRVKARKALILRKQFFEDLLNQRTLDGMTGMLERTYYKETISRLSSRYSGSELLEMAAEVHYKEVVNKVRSFSPEDARPVLDMLMRKWDILNLRTIISSKRSKKSWEEIMPYLVSAGELKPALLRKLVEAEPEKVYGLIKSTSLGRALVAQASSAGGRDFAQMLSKAQGDSAVLNELKALLDASYYNYLEGGIVSSDEDAPVIRLLVSREIDLRNVMNVLRLKRNGASKFSDVEPYLIRGGKLEKALVQKLLDSKGNADAVKIMRPLFRLEEGEYPSLSALEAALESSLAKERVRLFYRNPISLSTLVGFLMIKEEEMNNLRKIVRGRDYNLPPEEIRPMLVYY
ncbi:V-type ATPase subunit [Candidatus Micrarchaeota archaeon]|nr:V-type ATPase subunit [Candidatus Micrarchaeota archaeon]